MWDVWDVFPIYTLKEYDNCGNDVDWVTLTGPYPKKKTVQLPHASSVQIRPPGIKLKNNMDTAMNMCVLSKRDIQ